MPYRVSNYANPLQYAKYMPGFERLHDAVVNAEDLGLSRSLRSESHSEILVWFMVSMRFKGA